MEDLAGFEEAPIRTVNIGEFNPAEDQINDDEHLLVYIFSLKGPNGNKHFKYGTTERYRNGKDRGKYARTLFRKRLEGYSTEIRPTRKLEGLYILPRNYDGIDWTDTKVGNKFFKGFLGLPESDEYGRNEVVTGTTIEELEDTLIEQFGGKKKKSIYNDGGYHTYQKEVADEIYDAVERRVKNGNTESLDVLSYLAARFGKTRTFLKTVKQLWEDFGYGAFVISPYWLSVHNGFEDAIAEYKEFDDLVFVDALPDSDLSKDQWRDQLEWAYKRDDKFPVVAVSLCKGEEGKRDIQPITYVPANERITLIDEADFGAHTEDNEELIEYIEEAEHASRSWGPRNEDLVPVNIYTTGSGKEKVAKYDKDWDLMRSIPYLQLVNEKRAGDPSLQHIVEPNFLQWDGGVTLADEIKNLFPQKNIPSLYQLAAEAEQNEHVWRMIFSIVFSDYPSDLNLGDEYKGFGPASPLNIVNAATKHIPNFNKTTDGLGVMAKMPSTEKTDLMAIANAADEELDEWAVMPLCGQVRNEDGEVIYEGTTNSDAEDEVEEFMENEYNPDQYNRGVLVLTMGMGFRSFTVPDISVVTNFSDGGSASTVLQAALRGGSAGNLDLLGNGKEKKEFIFADFGFDQSKEQNAVTKIMARNVFAERDSERSNGETLAETNRRIFGAANVFRYIDEERGFGSLKPSGLLSNITRTNEMRERAEFSTNFSAADKSDKVREILGKANATDINEHVPGSTNIKGGAAGTGGGSGGGGNTNADVDELAEKAALLRAMGFLIPAYAPTEKSVFAALDVISADEKSRKEWTSLCGVEPEEYKKLLRPTEDEAPFLPIDEISAVYESRGDISKAAMTGVLGANKLFEIPQNMAEDMASSVSENLLTSGNGTLVLDAAGPNIVEALRNQNAENVVVLTRLHVAKKRILNEFPDATVYVVDVKEGESLRDAYERKINNLPMEFDVALGNPPYHKRDGGGGQNVSASPIYDDFVHLAESVAQETCLVIPARWFSGGKGLNPFRKWMLNRNDIVSITHDQDVFNTVDIRGGVCVVHANENKDVENPSFNGNPINIGKYDILVPDTEAYSVIDCVLQNADRFLDNIYVSRGHSGISTSDDRMKDDASNGDVLCYASKQQGFENYVDPDTIKTDKLDEWKVVTPYAGKKEYKMGFANIFIAKPGETFSDTYVAFEVESAREAVSLKSYMRTNFAEYMLDLRKNSITTSDDVVSWIPVPPLDRIWTDEELAEEELFGLSQEQWKQFTQQDD